jgi:hypothetical protein
MVTVEETLIEGFPIMTEFGVLVARDVLHYLSQADGESLLAQAVRQSTSANAHYIETFTEISRINSEGTKVHIEGEAQYTQESFARMIERVYGGWDVTLHWNAHMERDTRTQRRYFEATRATVVALRTPPSVS